jgi:hypothetical protein
MTCALQRRLRLALGLPLAVVLTACGTTVKMLPESLDCPVLEQRLATTCAAPTMLPDGASFEQLIRASMQDRQALLVCEKRRADLAQTVRLCNQAVADHLQQIKAINQAAQAAR